LAKRLSDKQKEEIIAFFRIGKNIEQLSKQFNCTKLTISRNLKKILGEKEYKETIKKLRVSESKKLINHNNSSLEANGNNSEESAFGNLEHEFISKSQFIEITPLNYEIDNCSQKDFASIPLSDVQLPKIVYMIVDKKVELETKYLKDYPKWQFLSEEELKRKSIEIYYDLKLAKSSCGKEQKLIKVPNTKVFGIVAPILLARGISRIVSADNLIAL
tara:strand:- start:907 stop:1557 length:651 start_codon:yes stop_codon:yes gene_type:complete